MAQAIKYQDTIVPAERSADSISTLVRKYGAADFTRSWDELGNLTGIRFTLRTEMGDVPIRIEARTDTILGILRGAYRRVPVSELQARAHRIAWRHLHDLTEQLLLAVKLGLKSVGGAFADGVEVMDPATAEVITLAELLARYTRPALVSGAPLRLLLTAGER